MTVFFALGIGVTVFFARPPLGATIAVFFPVWVSIRNAT